ncbi:hypothetical protein TWF788_004761 [Orbilia oligospora]|uniref:C-CAP/cofactor C-like domain-containing protein n=1 Tax=Orbilia oligospora TaxID=2813651 RepID=A0A7C8P254_ORBOL|nr:hypothetical protein TWF788_004761 [Orbilia oligospora]
MDEEAIDLKPIFHKSFNENILSLSSKISNLTSIRSSQQQTAISDVLSKISELTLELKDASNYLPAYDQKVYSEQLKAVTEELNIARKSVAPRSKFSFKNRRTGSSTASASSDTTLTPAVSTPQKPASISPPPPSSNLQTISLTSLTSTHTTPPPPTPQSTILSLSSLTSCIITPPPPFSSSSSSTSSNYFTTTSINTIKSSILILPKITGPAHLTSLKNSVLVISCHQFRLHDSSDLDVYLRCRSRPIIERCKGVRVSFLPEVLKGILDGDDNKDDDEEGVEEDKWNQIDDFNWLKEGRPSPNWRVLEEGERIKREMWERVLEDNSGVGDEGISGLLP